jgi:ligand-binding sensor domain-containing protein/two-component sensor histidine kinase
MTARAIAIAACSLCLWSETLPIRSYTIADGLPSDEIDGITNDSRGFVWFYTPEGLARFDGFRITRFGRDQGLPSRVVQAFLETRSGEYLIGTARGLCKFKSGTGTNQFETFLPGTKPEENSISALYQSPSGTVFVGTWDGLFEITDGPVFKRRKLPDPPAGWKGVLVSDIVEDKCGKLWLASIFGIYVIGRDGDVQWLARRGSIKSEVVNALLKTKDGRLWAGGRAGLLLLDDGCEAGHAPAVLRIDPEEAGQDVRALAEGTDGVIWIATGNGIFRRPPGGASQLLSRAQGLTDRSIFSLAIDKSGNLWAGTEGAGAMKIEPDGLHTFREQDGLRSDRVFSVLGDRAGRTVAVTGTEDQTRWSLNVLDGVLDGGKFRALQAPKVFVDQRTWGDNRILIQGRSGEWWAATSIGLCRYGRGAAESLANRAPAACYFADRDVFQIFEDSKGGIWASAQSPEGDRLMRWDPEKNAIVTFEEFPRRPSLVKSFAEDRQGNIWMGLWSPGNLYRYDGRNFVKFTAAAGLPPGTVFALLVDASGRLWIGAEGGLGMVENPAAKVLSVRRYLQPEGLSSEVVRALVDDEQGNIYAGTAAGVDRLDPKTGYIRHFSTADGLARGQIHSAFRDGGGNLWFATAQGLSRLTPALAGRLPHPAVVITAVEAGGMPFPVSPHGNLTISDIELEPSHDQLQVEFVAFAGEPENNVRYAYKLAGSDQDWSPLRRDHLVNYAALGAGKYRLLVKAVNSDGLESAVPAEVDFTVLPPFWRRWWFEASTLAVLAGIVYLLHSYRVAQMVNLERMRTLIATDLHDDIGSGLSQIAILSEVARARASSGDRMPMESLERVGALARQLVDSMSDIVWSIRSEPDSFDSLISRMREFAIDLLVSQGIGFELRAPGVGEHVKLSLQARRQLFLLFKECVHNAARHSGCSKVTTTLLIEDKEILLAVGDNGKGLRADEKPPGCAGGNGIPGMRQRAESIGGSIRFDSPPGQGCTVSIRAPASHNAFTKA